MQEKRKVVITKTRGVEFAAKDFSFTEADIPAASGLVASYRARAWDAFKRQTLPDTTLDAWRRTDIHTMPVDTFKLSSKYSNLPSVPNDLLSPLAADQHGGQIVLFPGGSKIDLDASLAKQGVIFTDFKTAQEKHADIVEKILGQTVNVEEGKFAALAGAFSQNGIVLYVPKNVKIERPLHSILWGPGANLAHISHLLVFIDEGASATYVHESASPTESATRFTQALLKSKSCRERVSSSWNCNRGANTFGTLAMSASASNAMATSIGSLAQSARS